jgi:hypothetical protein
VGVFVAAWPGIERWIYFRRTKSRKIKWWIRSIIVQQMKQSSFLFISTFCVLIAEKGREAEKQKI